MMATRVPSARHVHHRRGGEAARRFEELGHPAPVLRRDVDERGEAETIEVRPRALLPGAVDLVHGHEHRVLAAAQYARDLLVERRQAGPPVDHEDYEVGLLDGRHDLIPHGRDEVRLRARIEAARVHDGGLPALEGSRAIETVPGHPGHVVDDGASAADQAIEERGLADVGTAHESDDGAHHGETASAQPAEQRGDERAPETGSTARTGTPSDALTSPG